VREKVDKHLIEAHGKEYGTRQGFKRGYERCALGFGGKGESGMRAW